MAESEKVCPSSVVAIGTMARMQGSAIRIAIMTSAVRMTVSGLARLQWTEKVRCIYSYRVSLEGLTVIIKNIVQAWRGLGLCDA